MVAYQSLIAAGAVSDSATSSLLSFPGDQGENKINLLAIGDSRTFQNQDSSAWAFSYRFNQGYINHAMSLVGERYNWRKEYNLGVQGATASGFDATKATVIPAAMSRRPANERWDAVWWMGINEAIGFISPTAFDASFKSVMRYLMNVGIQNIYVLSEVPYPLGYGGESARTHEVRIANIKGYNAAMRSFCSRFPNMHFIDLYATYGSPLGGPDVSNVLYNGTDIHPGSVGSLVIGKVLADKITEVRGKFLKAPGVSLSPNPWLEGIEGLATGLTANNYYCIDRSTSGVTLSRADDDGALVITLNAIGKTARDFNIFNSATAFGADVMAGDVLAMCLDFEILEATGATLPPWGQIKENAGTNFAAANWNPASYSKGTLAVGRQLYMSDPHLITAGKGGTSPAMQAYLNSQAPAGTYVKFKLYEVSTRRIYTTPNAEYSAAATIPAHRHNIKCLTSTAAAGFTLTLPALYNVPDGTVKRFQDYQGAASTKNVTIAGNGAELIKDGASSGNTVVLNTDYFNKAYRADRGTGAWLAE